MPRMRNSQGQRIDPRTNQPYDPESRPTQHRTRSDPEPTANRPQPQDEPLALTYS